MISYNEVIRYHHPTSTRDSITHAAMRRLVDCGEKRPALFRYTLVGWLSMLFVIGSNQQRTSDALPHASDSLAFEVADVEGRLHRSTEWYGHRAIVLFFIAYDCPISNRYAPEMNRLVTAYARKHIAFFMVHTDPTLSPQDAKRHAQAFGYSCPVLLDPKRVLVKLAGATVTPEAAVLSVSGKLLYRGRIDDTYSSLGVRRPRPTRQDVREALDAILMNQAVQEPLTRAVGCFITDSP